MREDVRVRVVAGAALVGVVAVIGIVIAKRQGGEPPPDADGGPPAGGVPTTAGADFDTFAEQTEQTGRRLIGMTLEEADAALGVNHTAGKRLAGDALIRSFVRQNRLVRLHVTRFDIDAVSLPRVSDALAQELTGAEFARRAVDHNLPFTELEERIGDPGRRWWWSIASDGTWEALEEVRVWRVDESEQGLFIEVTGDGQASQPVTRHLPPRGAH